MLSDTALLVFFVIGYSICFLTVFFAYVFSSEDKNIK